jgi:hypothetical protein
LNWPQILDQAGNIAIGLLGLFVGVPIVVLIFRFLGNLLVNMIALPIAFAIVGVKKLYRWLRTPNVTQPQAKLQPPELTFVDDEPAPIIPLPTSPNRSTVRSAIAASTVRQDMHQEGAARVDSYIPPKFNTPDEKTLNQLPFDAGDAFSGELTGKCLRGVCGIRTVDQDYRYDDEVERFWLIFEAEAAEQLIWVSPQWRYFGANEGFKLWYEARLVAAGKSPLVVKTNEVLLALPQWQALIGVPVYKVGKHSTINAPLVLIFDADEEMTRPAHICFDSEDLDEPLLINLGGLSDEKCHWALSDEVQFYLNLGHPDWATIPVWSTPRNTPTPPWNDKNHLDTLIQLRRLLQDTVIWLSTFVFLPVPYGDIDRHLNYLWTALDELCAFEIALTRRRHYVRNNPSWLDRDGESYGSAWESMSEFEVALKAVNLQITQSKWHHGLLEIERANVFQKHESLLLAAYGNESAFTEIAARFHERIQMLEDCFKAWDTVFAACLEKTKFS